MTWIYLLIKSGNLIQRILNIKKKIKQIRKFVKNLCQKLRESKSIKSTTSNLASINLLIIRDTFTDVSTLGQLFLNGERFCDTLAKDSRGCILVGQGSQQNIVHNSVLAMDLLMKEIINLGGMNINLIIKNK